MYKNIVVEPHCESVKNGSGDEDEEKYVYNGTKTRVRTVVSDSKHFLAMIGLHQGPTLSSFLFALMTMDVLTQHIQD
ncbi:hypothetical protein H5410_006493 [Solanum commersonii]|uniref:Uncharacterized protein n=1 Tax=Solanum commersonii TaxID=4109 RepID=A0A9J6AAF6_SOLCO|nr:hypothetical protein H5410_006493 [Solanum commersonii]